MEGIGDLMAGFAVVLSWQNLLYMVVGIILGVIIAAVIRSHETVVRRPEEWARSEACQVTSATQVASTKTAKYGHGEVARRGASARSCNATSPICEHYSYRRHGFQDLSSPTARVRCPSIRGLVVEVAHRQGLVDP